MDLELVTIGTELLLGFTVDTNSAYIGQVLAGAGVRIVRRTSVRDEPNAVGAAVREALGRTGMVLTTGGLGPTRDDLSKDVVAGVFEAPLEFHQDIWDDLVARWARMGRVISERNRGQALVPRGAVVLPNRRGSAPGLWLSGAPGEVIMLPGVPAEMKGLLLEEVVPRLLPRVGGTVVRSRTLRTTGIPESTLAERISDIEDALAPVTLAYLPSILGVDLRLTAWGVQPAEADRLLQESGSRLLERLGQHAYGTGETDLAAVLLEACRARGLTVTVAESCTGGMIAERITAISGSSDVFLGGVVAYANSIKEELGVAPRILTEHGAVSEETVKAMATAARRKYSSDLTVSVSGIAGPGGGSEGKPVGTVWFAFADAKGVSAERYVFPGSREDIRARATQFALFGLLSRAKSAGA